MHVRSTRPLPLSALVFTLTFGTLSSASAQTLTGLRRLQEPAKQAAPAPATQPAATQKVLLTYKAQVGQTKRSSANVELTAEIQGQRLSLQMKETSKVSFTKVDPNGQVTWESKTEALERFFNGMKAPDDPDVGKEVSTFTVKPNGELVTFKSTDMEKDPDHPDERIFLASQIIYPDKQVGVGDKWVHEHKADATLGTPGAKSEFELQAFEEKNGVLCARIAFNFGETAGKQPITARGYVWIEPASGDDVASEYAITNIPFGEGQTVNGAIKANRENGGPLPAEMVAKLQGGLKPEKGTTIAGPIKAEPPKEKSIDDVVKDFEKLPGLITLWRKKEAGGKETLYAELREDQLGKLLLLQATASTGDAEHIVAGDPIGDLAFEFIRSPDDKIYLAVPNTNWRVEPGSPIQRALGRSMPQLAFLQTFRIEAKQNDRRSFLIDLSDFFKSDLMGITQAFSGMPPFPGMMPSPGAAMGLDREKTYVVALKNLPENLVVRSQYHFVRGSNRIDASTLADPRSAPIFVTFNLSPLPLDNGYMPRYADPRVGYFPTEFGSFDRDDISDLTKRFIIRWDIRKKDPMAKVSDPVKPIVFWIDNAMPTEYRAAVRDALLVWNKAFLRIGLSNVVQVKQMPDVPDPEELRQGTVPTDTADTRFNFVRWVLSPGEAYAVAQPRYSPITGQILNASITVDAGIVRVTKLERKQIVDPLQAFERVAVPLEPSLARRHNHNFFCEYANEVRDFAWLGMSAVNALAAEKISEKDYINQFLRDVVSHEFGHCLGLRHNFVASNRYSLAQLSDPKVIGEGALTASVMDYTPFNLSALTAKGVPFWSQGLGSYDFWAVEYGYTPMPSARKPEDERPMLQQIARRSGEVGHAYNTDGEADGFDPTITRFDLSGDPLAYWEKTLTTSRSLLLNLDARVPKNGESYAEFTNQAFLLLNMMAQSAGQAARFVGAQNVRRSHKGDVGEKPVLTPQDAATQRRAITMLVQNILAPGALKLPQRFYGKLTNDLAPISAQPAEYPMADTLAGLQKSVVRRLLSAQVLARVANNEFKVGDPSKAVTLPYLFRVVADSVWGELAAKKNVDYMRRQVQRQHVETLIGLATSNATDDARMLAWAHLRMLKEKLAAALTNPALDEYTRLHLTDLNGKVQRLLEAKQTIGGSGGGSPFPFFGP